MPFRPIPPPEVPIADQNLALRAQQDWYDYLSGLGAGADATSGGGNIAFPATQVPSADPNTLDDYEEGSWTPTYTASGGAPSGLTYTTRDGRYVKVGKLVFFSFIVTGTFSSGTGSGDIRVTGLPFVHEASGNQQSGGSCAFGGVNKAGFTQVTCVVNASTDYVYFVASGMGGASIPSNVTASDMTGSLFVFAGGGSYRAA